MIEQKICTCGAPLRFVPAGVSKRTGKPYNGFWACTANCSQKAKKTQETSKFQEKQPIIDESVKEYNKGKTDNMTELGAKRIAGEYANILLQMSLISKDEWTKTFRDKANEIYNTRCVPYE
jgi:hypothetical protein